MVTKEQVISILKQNEISDQDIVELIQFYIYDRKGINITVQLPDNSIRHHLARLALKSISKYYSDQQ